MLIVAPQVRRQLSMLLRQHIDDLFVFGFTELPDNRKINVISTISNESDAEPETKE